MLKFHNKYEMRVELSSVIDVNTPHVRIVYQSPPWHTIVLDLCCKHYYSNMDDLSSFLLDICTLDIVLSPLKECFAFTT